MPKDGGAGISHAESPPYPGSLAETSDLLQLADAYRCAAAKLFDQSKGSGPVAQAPARFCAIHAIELYINVFLRHSGRSAEQVRAKMHALDDPNFADALNLRGRTRQHLQWMTENI